MAVGCETDLVPELTETRIDKWLWAVRVFKTRQLASEACKGGHAQLGDRDAKASTVVHIGDRVTVRAGGRQRELEVTKVIEKRVGAKIAAECFIDHTPAPEPEADAAVMQRDARTGRPTKRDRRDIERLRGLEKR